MGHIDLDPASCAQANLVVKAGDYFTAESDGLAPDWRGNVFLNPPGGLVGAFWRKAVKELDAGRVSQLIYIGYSLEQLATLQNVGAPKTPLDFSICVPKKRIQFTPESGVATSPTHANFICYVGPCRKLFKEYFGAFGAVVIR